ncbi:hypothetical protein SAMN05216358_4001 [Rhizobium sp. AN5]|nr:hypothetical protein SAMN05216358_4001 [Rhizobium sp. AN5]
MDNEPKEGVAPPSALPGISPTRREIGKTRCHHFILQRQDGQNFAAY